MGRARAYDEDTVLSGAMHAFRRKGYQGVSVRDLEHATGLKMGSIYNSYGDKSGLFDAAFTHYNRVVLQRRIERHAPPESGLRGLRDLFLSLLHEPGGTSFGCLITNSAVEFGGGGSAHPCISEGLRILSKAFADRLALARREGAAGAGVDLAATSAKLLALYQGVLVLIRAGHGKAALARMINDEFDKLEKPS
jgi:TetR/AcrR family transcriptional repressor of nem operon